MRRPGEDSGSGRREVGSGRFSEISGVILASDSALASTSSLLLDPEWPAAETRGDVGDQSICSLPAVSETWSGRSEGDS